MDERTAGRTRLHVRGPRGGGRNHDKKGRSARARGMGGADLRGEDGGRAGSKSKNDGTLKRIAVQSAGGPRSGPGRRMREQARR